MVKDFKLSPVNKQGKLYPQVDSQGIVHVINY